MKKVTLAQVKTHSQQQLPVLFPTRLVGVEHLDFVQCVTDLFVHDGLSCEANAATILHFW
jgi:hypothetical protein